MAFVLYGALAGPVCSGFTAYFGNEPGGFPTEQDWYTDVGSTFTTMDFVLPPWELLTDQYAHLGVTFPEGDEFVDYGNYEDLYGASAGNPIGAFMEVAFDTPHKAFMVKFPGLGCSSSTVATNCCSRPGRTPAWVRLPATSA